MVQNVKGSSKIKLPRTLSLKGCAAGRASPGYQYKRERERRAILLHSFSFSFCFCFSSSLCFLIFSTVLTNAAVINNELRGDRQCLNPNELPSTNLLFTRSSTYNFNSVKIISHLPLPTPNSICDQHCMISQFKSQGSCYH